MTRLHRWALPGSVVAGILVLLELVVRAELIPSRHFPPISATVRTLAGQLPDSGLWTAVLHTLQGWALGLGIAIVLAVPLGIVVGSSRLLFRSTRLIIEFLRPVPSVALVPVAVLVYGTGLESKVFLAAFAAFWPILVQVLYGVQDVDPVAEDTARSFGFTRIQRLRQVTLPSTLPYIATGVQIASAVALILSVTAELVIGAPGLGLAITVARSGGNVELMYALIIVTGLLGWVTNVALGRVERRVLHWHPAQRRERVATA